MLPNQIPSVFQIFNKESIEKTNTARQFLGLKKINNSFGGLYGVDFNWETSLVNKSGYIPCFENGCSFRGTSSMIEFHMKTVHENGLESRFEEDGDAWRRSRQKNFPKVINVKPKCESEFKMSEKRGQKRNGKREKNVDKVEKEEVMRPPMDPIMAILDRPQVEKSVDLLGLGAVYGSSDEETVSFEETPVDPSYQGLPTPQQLDAKQLQKRRNKFKFPILPSMELQSKRDALMNPQRRYHETFNRKVKRPRLTELLLAEEMHSERNVVLQCIRYLCNKRFFDASLEHVAVTAVDGAASASREEEPEEEMGEIFHCVDDADMEDGEIMWSDDEL